MKSETRARVDSILLLFLSVIVLVQMWRESNYRATIKALSAEVRALREADSKAITDEISQVIREHLVVVPK